MISMSPHKVILKKKINMSELHKSDLNWVLKVSIRFRKKTRENNINCLQSSENVINVLKIHEGNLNYSMKVM